MPLLFLFSPTEPVVFPPGLFPLSIGGLDGIESTSGVGCERSPVGPVEPRSTWGDAALDVAEVPANVRAS
ncbi:MAG TPA: hypothetical protein VI076_02535, partial [Actinopolymorphaceae bacterium]